MDEEFTKSDEEYDDLAMLDIQQGGYGSDRMVPVSGDDQIPKEVNDELEEIQKENPSCFSRTKSETLLEPPLRRYSSFHREKNEKRAVCNGNVRIKKRSLSIPSLGKHGP